MTSQEQQLIDAIKALPGHQVFKRDGAVVIAYNIGTRLSQRSVWLGRSSTLDNLQSILAAAKEA